MNSSTYLLPSWVGLIILLGFFCCKISFAQESVSYDNARATLIVNVVVSALDPGRVEEIKVKNGDMVNESTVVARLNSNTFESDVKISELELKIAEVRAIDDLAVEIARKTELLNSKVLERSKNSNISHPKSISQTELERLQLQLEQSQLLIEQAESESKINSLTYQLRGEQANNAKIRLENRIIRAPSKGVIEELFVQKGEWVSSGQPIARIINLERLRIQAFFKADFIKKINQKSNAYFEYEHQGISTQVKAQISFVGSEIESETQDFVVWAEVENQDKNLFPGIKGTLVVELVSPSQPLTLER